MRILGIILARGGSKGVPGKNIRLLGDKPLLSHSAQVALRCGGLSKSILSSDDPAIIAVGKEAGLEVPFTRPAELALDHTPTVAVITHAVEFMESVGERFDAVCLLQPTSPFRTVEFLDAAIAKFIDAGTDSLVSVRRVPHEYNPHWVFEASADGTLKISTGEVNIIPRRQDLPEAYHRDGSIYLSRVSAIKRGTLYGDSIGYLESPRELYVNIDTEEDWQKAEQIFKSQARCAE